MKKYIAIKEGRTIKKYNLSKIATPMVMIRDHLYTLHEFEFHLDKGCGDAIKFTDLESTQYYGDAERYINPDETIAVLDTAPNLKQKVKVWNRLTDGGGMTVIYAALGIIMVIYVIGMMLK